MDFEHHTREFYRQYFEQWQYFGDARSSFSDWQAAAGGPFGRPGVSVRVGKRRGDQVLFEARYSFDRFGRRTHPMGAAGSEFALLAGGTQVFGEAVDDEHTIAAWLQGLAPSLRAYNYGFLGHGPQNLLYRCERGFAPGEIEEPTGVVFCFYRDDSVSIAVGKRPWARRHPYYAIGPSGALELRGDFDSGGAAPCPEVHLPSDCRDADFAVTAKIYSRTRERFPGCRFWVVLEPVTFTAARMAGALAEEQVPVLDLACVDLDLLAWPTSRVADTNLTSDGNRVLAGLLARAARDNSLAETLSGRRRDIEALTATPDPEQAALYGGFLFNYYDIFPMDDALDLAVRCGAGGDDALKHRLVERCRAGFDLKKRLVHHLQECGLLDQRLRPAGGVTAASASAQLPRDHQLPERLLGIFLDCCLGDHERLSWPVAAQRARGRWRRTTRRAAGQAPW